MSNKAETIPVKQDAKRELKPKLRFPEFRDEAVWMAAKLGEQASILKGRGISKADIDENGQQPCIRYGELYTHYGEVIKTVFLRTKAPASELFFSKINDVIIPGSGETKIDIAKASCVLCDNVALGGDINVIRSDLNGTFLSYYLNGPKKLDIAKVAQGDTVVHLYPSQLEQLEIAIPHANEQQKIAECLTSLDELIASHGHKLDALKCHKKGLMQQLFPLEAETVPRFRFPEFQDASEWVEKKLDDLVHLQDGFAFKSTDFVKSTEDATQVIRITDINNKNTNEGKVYIPNVFLKTNDLTKYSVEDGDLLLSLTGAAGFNFFFWDGGRAVINQRTAKVTPKKKSDYAVVRLLEPLVHKKINARGEGQNNNLSKDFLSSLVLLIPEPEEQQRIADSLSTLDDLIAAQTNELDTLKFHKKGLMQQLFPSTVEAEL